jgi:hypothetical protein
MQIDLDNLDGALDSAREQLRNDPRIAFGFVSPGGNGLKLGLHINGDNHAALFDAAQSYFKVRYGLAIDEGVKSPVHLCLVSHDSLLWRNPTTVVFSVADVTAGGWQGTTSDATSTTTSTTTLLRDNPLIDNVVLETLARRYLPTARHQNNRRLFEMARAVKGIEKQEGEELSIVRTGAVFNCWYENAKPYLRTEQSHEEYYAEFLRALACVKYPLGEDALKTAWERAQAAEPPPEAAVFKDGELRTLICLCRELQQLVTQEKQPGEPAFFLSSYVVQRLFGFTDNLKGWRWLMLLCRARILKRVQKGNQHRANRYRYLLPLLPAREIYS